MKPTFQPGESLESVTQRLRANASTTVGMSDFIAAVRTAPAKPGDPLKSAVRGVGWIAGVALITATAMMLVGFTDPNTPQIWISLYLLSMVGWHAHTALRLLQTRVVRLEEELAALRAEMESTRRVAEKEALAESSNP